MPIILDSDIVFIRNDIYIMCICIIRISDKFGQYIINIRIKIRSQQL